ncbi:MAG: hypothetical protein R2699_07525 [Acidimicrobiales bacterium]
MPTIPRASAAAGGAMTTFGGGPSAASCCQSVAPKALTPSTALDTDASTAEARAPSPFTSRSEAGTVQAEPSRPAALPHSRRRASSTGAAAAVAASLGG